MVEGYKVPSIVHKSTQREREKGGDREDGTAHDAHLVMIPPKLIISTNVQHLMRIIQTKGGPEEEKFPRSCRVQIT